MWYEVKYRYEKTLDNGVQKKVTEQYVVETVSFGEAEAAIVSEMAAYVSAGETDVRAVAKAPYAEVLFNDEDSFKFYKAKVSILSIDEKTEKVRRNNINYLVQASSIADARSCICEHFAPTMIDYEIVALAETQIIAVFERSKAESTTK
nr:MAG TPA: protein of unknown function (DUF4494) [Caudoviricetes sp.]